MQVLKSRPTDWDFKFNLTVVPHDGSAYKNEFSVLIPTPVFHYGQEYRLTTSLLVCVEAIRSGERIITSVSVETEIETQCARCLEPARKKISSALRWIFSITKEDDGQGDEWENDEIVLLDKWEEPVPLGDYIWETLITALPVAVLCRDDCCGLCPNCGANLNNESCNCQMESGDPRFEILKNLL